MFRGSNRFECHRLRQPHSLGSNYELLKLPRDRQTASFKLNVRREPVYLTSLITSGPGKYTELESMRRRFVKEINAYYLFERNKVDGDLPNASRRRRARAATGRPPKGKAAAASPVPLTARVVAPPPLPSPSSDILAVLQRIEAAQENISKRIANEAEHMREIADSIARSLRTLPRVSRSEIPSLQRGRPQ
ncbi:predicted protein [Histoplasma capsulatum var. duboisii H88]|uniref:Predicted protein n=1 Tax=Ajellomyces capsulatus (strain H88) TaxID=544711 RepID=F0UF23_AJEC8|nr:predicted protein [Histoplasma capsulatum var. duboisii H88]